MSTALSPERWARVQDVFHASLDQPAAARRSFVATSCAGDAELEREVLSLLSAHDDGGPLGDSPPEVPTPIPVPERVGPYRIVRLLGQGGMGTVFLAEREGEDFTQLVALKLMQAGYADPAVNARLSSERRILARLEHPGIARFIDGGTTEAGQPYVAMEYVEGTTLLEYCHAQRLTITQRLRLVLDMCEAVHYAHQQLVVHRDLKPGNILVSPEGRVKLLDFGIAKALDPEDASGDTQTGAWCTPAYASPEQIRGQRVSTLSDVYALGILLYEMLTGARPYQVDSPSPAEIERIVCEQDPSRPSAQVPSRRLARLLSGDLDTIVLKALEKEPSRRYPSVREFANDIQRYLDREPVRARPAGLVYRASKFTRRHRAAVTGAGLVVGSLLVGVVAAAWQADRASRERDRAELARQRSDEVSGFLIDLFEATDVGENTEPAREILRRGVARAEQLSALPVAQAQMFDALGRAYYNLQEFAESHELLMRALTIRDSLYPDGHPDLARTLAAIGATTGQRRVPGDSVRFFYERALAMGREHFGPEDTFAAEPLRALGRVAAASRDYEGAERYFLEALDILERASGGDDPAMGEVYIDLAHLKRRTRQLEEAARYHLAAIEHLRRTLGPDHERVGTALHHYGDLFADIYEDPSRAVPIYREGLDIQERALGPDHVGLMHGLNGLGMALAAVGDHEQGEVVMRRAVHIHRSVFGDHHIGTARQVEQLAGVLFTVGKYDEALTMYEEVIETKQDILGDATVGGTYFSVAATLQKLGRIDEALEAAFRGLAIREVNDINNLAPSYRMIAELYLATQRHAEAERWLLDAERASAGLVAGHPERIRIFEALAALYDGWGRADDAEVYRQRVADATPRP